MQCSMSHATTLPPPPTLKEAREAFQKLKPGYTLPTRGGLLAADFAADFAAISKAAPIPAGVVEDMLRELSEDCSS